MKTTTTVRLTGIALAALGLFAFAPRAEAAYTDDCITFTSEAEFSLRVDQPTWLLIPSDGRGKMLVSTDKTNWAEWGGGEGRGGSWLRARRAGTTPERSPSR